MARWVIPVGQMAIISPTGDTVYLWLEREEEETLSQEEARTEKDEVSDVVA